MMVLIRTAVSAAGGNSLNLGAQHEAEVLRRHVVKQQHRDGPVASSLRLLLLMMMMTQGHINL